MPPPRMIDGRRAIPVKAPVWEFSRTLISRKTFFSSGTMQMPASSALNPPKSLRSLVASRIIVMPIKECPGQSEGKEQAGSDFHCHQGLPLHDSPSFRLFPIRERNLLKAMRYTANPPSNAATSIPHGPANEGQPMKRTEMTGEELRQVCQCGERWRRNKAIYCVFRCMLFIRRPRGGLSGPGQEGETRFQGRAFRGIVMLYSSPWIVCRPCARMLI